MQFIQHYSHKTLNAIIADLRDVRYLTRDDACAALATINACVHHATQQGGYHEPYLVVPTVGAKKGFRIVTPQEIEALSSPEDEQEPDDTVQKSETFTESEDRPNNDLGSAEDIIE